MSVKSPIFTVLIILAFLGPPARAATFAVDDAGDSHDVVPGDGVCSNDSDPSVSRCTLRSALEEASALAGPDTVVIPGAVSPIYVSLGPLVCTGDSTVVRGDGSFPAVDGTDTPFASHLFHVLSNGNRIAGLTIRRSRHHGVLIEGADNVIGGETDADRNILISNGQDVTGSAAIAIIGTAAAGNRIKGNYIGLAENGTTVRPNRNGVYLSASAHDNLIDGNVISGNEDCGLILSGGAFDNTVTSNTIGPDVTASLGPGNAKDGILIEGNADENRIGSELTAGGNLISLNGGNGISIVGAHGNAVSGNRIGVDLSGRHAIGNGRAGICIADGSTENVIGGTTSEEVNVVSGNLGDGILIRGRGTAGNIVSGSYIGVGINGVSPLGNGVNAGHGVRVDSGASNNVIGGPEVGSGNVISGNVSAGVCITGAGSNNNRVTGNFIGVNVYGTSSLPNGTGVMIRDAASGNVIGGLTSDDGNLISGNRGDIFPFGCGVLISDPGTASNVVSGNYIGLDLTGTRALRNGSAGVVIGHGAAHNTIGGETTGQRNIISGNGVGSFSTSLGRGVHIFGPGTSFNRIIGNFIGTSVDGDSRVENIGHGIGLFAAAADNDIGGGGPESGNLVAMNGAHGIVISGQSCRSNLVRYNSTFENDSLAIAVRDGAQDGVTPPVITSASADEIAGFGAPPDGRVDVYLVAPDPSNRGEGVSLVGSALAGPDGSFRVTPAGLAEGDTVSAVAVDSDNNTSEFSENLPVTDVTSVNEDESGHPVTYNLSQNFPNPFNPATTIRFSLPRAADVDLLVYNVLGRRVRTLRHRRFPAGVHTVTWDGTDDGGSPVASGTYISRLTAGEFSATHKMLLLK
ncbi:MAG TPA: right-handed parallel beta-helix repeat-containing protein [Acidobacteriota bacterium]|nr:right-handed parallel beta-helix repeat-containing protein [Acidobacteriota bacterium]